MRKISQAIDSGGTASPLPEPDDVYVLLVAELFGRWAPAAVMGPTFLGIGLFIALSLASPLAMSATVAGGLLSAAKLGMMIAFRCRRARQLGRREARRWETGYSLVSIGLAAAVTLTAAAPFAARNLPLQIVAVGLLFGFCSGIVARASVRPRFAIVRHRSRWSRQQPTMAGPRTGSSPRP